MSQDERDGQSAALVSSVSSLPCFKNCKTLLCYYPIGEEPYILPLAELALASGKKLAFPISDTKTHTLSFRTVESLDELRIGAYRIPEPLEHLPELTDFHDALCIVPALVFDTSGRRLGYGKGFYDRFLSTFNGISVGLAYDRFVIDSIPHDENDLSVDIVITEKGGYNV